MAVKDAEDGLCKGDDLVFWQELLCHLRRHGLRSQTAAEQDFETALLFAVYSSDLGDEAQVVDVAQSGIRVAVAKADFDFAAHLLIDRIAQEVAKHRIGMRRDIKGLCRVDARVGRCGDIAHCVAAGLAQRDLVLLQLRPQLRGAVQAHVVNLDVLAGGGVQVAAAVLIGDIGDAAQLAKCYFAIGNLDADHLHAGLALPVDAAGEAEAAEFLFVDLALVKETDLALQVDDVLGYDGVFEFCSKALHCGFLRIDGRKGHKKRPFPGVRERPFCGLVYNLDCHSKQCITIAFPSCADIHIQQTQQAQHIAAMRVMVLPMGKRFCINVFSLLFFANGVKLRKVFRNSNFYSMSQGEFLGDCRVGDLFGEGVNRGCILF